MACSAGVRLAGLVRARATSAAYWLTETPAPGWMVSSPGSVGKCACAHQHLLA